MYACVFIAKKIAKTKDNCSKNAKHQVELHQRMNERKINFEEKIITKEIYKIIGYNTTCTRQWAHTRAGRHTQTHARKLTPSILFGLSIWPWKLLPNAPLSIVIVGVAIVVICRIVGVVVAKTIEVIAVLVLNSCILHTHI